MTITARHRTLNTVHDKNDYLFINICLDSDFSGAGPFGGADIFNSFFSNFGAGRNPFSGFQSMNEIETDVEAHISLSFMDAALGCKKTIRYKRNVNCSTCNGSGSAKGSSINICSNCKGSGQVFHITRL